MRLRDAQLVFRWLQAHALLVLALFVLALLVLRLGHHAEGALGQALGHPRRPSPLGRDPEKNILFRNNPFLEMFKRLYFPQ